MSIRAGLNRLYDRFLDWRIESAQHDINRATIRRNWLSESKAQRELIRWRWMEDKEFKQYVGHLSGKEFRKMQSDFPDFLERVAELFKASGYWSNTGDDYCTRLINGAQATTPIDPNVGIGAHKDFEELNAHVDPVALAVAAQSTTEVL